MCVCVCVCVRACVRACVRVCVTKLCVNKISVSNGDTKAKKNHSLRKICYLLVVMTFKAAIFNRILLSIDWGCMYT